MWNSYYDVETMNRHKYQVAGRNSREIWVCEACKKSNNDRILMGEWKLIDRCYDCSIPCGICEGHVADSEARH